MSVIINAVYQLKYVAPLLYFGITLSSKKGCRSKVDECGRKMDDKSEVSFITFRSFANYHKTENFYQNIGFEPDMLYMIESPSK